MSSSDISLSPPWYTTRNKLVYTLSMGPYVRVSSLIPVNSNIYIILIFVNSSFDVAQAVRAIIPSNYYFDNMDLITIVLGPNSTVVPVDTVKQYTPENIENLYSLALKDNPLFYGVIFAEDLDLPPEQQTLGDLIIVIRDYIIQFHNENFNNISQNYIDIASNVFTDVFNLEYNPNIKISFNTYDSKSTLIENTIRKCDNQQNRGDY